MPTVSELVEYFSEMTGCRPQEGVVRARQLREAGLLPSTGRGRGAAKVSAIDCAVYLVAWLAAERAINSAEAVRIFYDLQPHDVIGDMKELRPTAKNLLLLASHRRKKKPFLLPDTPFIEVIARMLEWAKSAEGADILQKDFISIGCGRDWPSAFITLRDAHGGMIVQQYRPPPIPDQPSRIRLTPWQTSRLSCPAWISTEANIPAEIILLLANFLDELQTGPIHIADFNPDEI